MSSPCANPGSVPTPDTNASHLLVLLLAGELARRARNQVILGAFLVGGGIVLTLVTFAGAKSAGMYAISWGLVLAGLIRIGTAAKKHSGARNDAIARYREQQVVPSFEHQSGERRTTLAMSSRRAPTVHQHGRVNVAATEPRAKAPARQQGDRYVSALWRPRWKSGSWRSAPGAGRTGSGSQIRS